MLNTDEIIRAGSDRLMAACRRLCSGTRYSADDLFQDTILAFIEKNAEGRILEYKSGLLPTMARNIVIDQARKDKSRSNISNAIQDGRDIACRDTGYESVEQVSIIRTAISTLSTEQSRVLEMRFDGHSFSEIALATGVSINTAVGRMRYARKNLAKLIK